MKFPTLIKCSKMPQNKKWILYQFFKLKLKANFFSSVKSPPRREHRFAYVPSTAEVLALEVLSRHEERNSLVVGMAIVKHDLVDGRRSGRDHFYLNVYSDPLDASNIGSLSQCAQTIELGFIPTRVLHTYVPYQVPKGCVNNAFLVFGMDDRIHTYMERGGLKFEAVSTERIFPEFGDEHSSYPTAVDIAYLDPRSEYDINLMIPFFSNLLRPFVASF